ncbi:MAG: UvrD-helicase domain-containing protein [Candidatus Eisenbacteria bacterium]|nr:UvrD-helicase domain-containing protein [Candidatus Eisenbacteria bacterium]
MHDELNPQQREAVSHVTGPLLVLAGAGSGKTRVIAHRVAFLVRECGVAPHQILAITFTRKAAGEMRWRIESLVGAGVAGMWVGTFHSVCARMLRQRGDPEGRGRDFVIYDEDDQRSLVKRLMRDMEVSDREFPPARVLERISRLKSELVGADEMKRLSMTHYDKTVARVYEAYQAALLKNNAMDFDDLLVNTVLLLSGSDDSRRHYSERFRHVLVDEYQDTNHAQYRILAELCRDRRNLCVVGDDDQSIYGWRGADIRNILEFESSFPETRVIRLEQNYRSTGLILDAANSVIKHNRGRKGKTLTTENEYGERLTLHLLPGEEEEAESVAEEIAAEQVQRGTPLSRMAVLYRTNAQSRSLEIALRNARINYQIVGAVSFYERREVKDVLAYLRLCVNPNDEVSLRRVLNVPPRRIGRTALERLEELARERGVTMFEALEHSAEDMGLPAATRASMADFAAFIRRLSGERPESVAELVEAVVKAVGYREYLEREASSFEDRLENVLELIASARQFDEELADGTRGALERGATDEPEPSPVTLFLSDISLISQIDAWHPEEDRVTLMTAHNAKGLEFDCVFITGLEEGLFPHCASMDSDEEIEEERRLFYVALTRARKRVVLTAAASRRRFDSFGGAGVSRFVNEIPEALLSTARVWEPAEGGRLVGREVLHGEFGWGRVVEQEGRGQRAKLTVQFPGNVVRKIMARYVQLKGA